MADDELQIEECDNALVTTYRQHIEEIFAVKIQGLFGNSIASEARAESVVTATTTTRDSSLKSGNDGNDVSQESKRWIKVIAASKGQDGLDNVERAKAYILSLTAPEPVRCNASLTQLSQETLTTLTEQRDEIERQSQAVMEVQLDGRTVHVWGHKVNVAMARSLLDQNIQHLKHDGHDKKTSADLSSDISRHRQDQDAQGNLTVQVHSKDTCSRVREDASSFSFTLSPNAESNNDSCYNSDTSPSNSRRNSSHHYPGDPHSDVSRTTSDTLAAELQDDPAVDLAGAPPRKTADSMDHSSSSSTTSSSSSHGSPAEQAGAVLGDNNIVHTAEAEQDSPSVHSTSSSASTNATSPSSGGSSLEELVASNPEYASKVEFAIKLGYSEEQLQTALQKLGPDVNQNELLSELISLGSTGGQHDSDDSDLEDFDADSSAPPAEVPDPWVFEAPVLEKVEPPVSSEGNDSSNLRPIVIDGSNVAMSHGNKEVFSCQGIKLAVDWFQQRGHPEITVFVPQWRKETSRPDTPINDQEVLYELERQKVLVFTPARRVGGRRVVCYDDRYILKLAAENGGIVVSNDNYRDLMAEKDEFKRVIEERLLMYSFVNNRFMPPDDPLGRHGPSLDNFLSLEPMVPEVLPPICPYGKKCTYGNKCKYYHPERGSQPHKSVTQILAEKAKIKIKDFKQREQLGHSLSTGATKHRRPSPDGRKAALTKTKSCLTPGGRTPLGRTKSLSPAQPLRQFDHSDLYNSSLAAPTVREPDTNPEPPVSISVMSGEESPIDNAKYREYNDKLAECREKMDQAEALERTKHRSLATRGQQQAVSPQNSLQGHLSAQLEPPGASLKPPQDHWSLSHAQLQPTHSEPPIRYGEGGGHLALAKKLSDEGHKSDGERPRPRELSRSFGELAAPNPAPPRIIRETLVQDSENFHQKLNRQLSLKGSEDPRLRQHGVKQHPVLKQCNSEGPGRVSKHSQPAKWRLGGVIKGEVADWYQSGHQAEERFINAAQPSRHRELRPTASYHQPVTINTDLLHPGMNHNPLARMASAPVTQQSIAAIESPGRTVTVPHMSRQNSTSEPHLFSYQNLPRNIHPEQQLSQVPQSPWNNEVMFQVYENAEVNSPATFDPQTVEYSHQSLYDPGNPASVLNQSRPFAMSVHAQPFSPKHSNPSTPKPPEFAGPHHVMSSPDMTHFYNPRPSPQPVQRPAPTQYHSGPVSRSENIPSQPDPRLSIYYHLCGLFPQDKVFAVMMQHPEETNPQILCRYLVSMN